MRGKMKVISYELLVKRGKMKTKLLTFLFMLPLMAAAQTIKVEGQVVEHDGTHAAIVAYVKHLPHVAVKLYESVVVSKQDAVVGCHVDAPVLCTAMIIGRAVVDEQWVLCTSTDCHE